MCADGDGPCVNADIGKHTLAEEAHELGVIFALLQTVVAGGAAQYALTVKRHILPCPLHGRHSSECKVCAHYADMAVGEEGRQRKRLLQRRKESEVNLAHGYALGGLDKQFVKVAYLRLVALGSNGATFLKAVPQRLAGAVSRVHLLHLLLETVIAQHDADVAVKLGKAAPGFHLVQMACEDVGGVAIHDVEAHK